MSPLARARGYLASLVLIPALFVALAATAHAWNSTLVPVDASGRLSYVADAEGNRIPDFSNAGYRGGGVPLPADLPIVRTLAPTTGDQTARIQAALDEVGALPLQPNGYRGTLQLAAGVWEVVGTIRIRHSGVVLAGVGDRDDPSTNTILRRTGTAQADVITAGTRNDSFRGEIANSRSQITTPRVPVGARSFEVDRPELYRVGDAVIVWHPSTQAWLDAVDRGGVSDNNYWRPGEIDLRYHRYITAISGHTITVDAPVFNHLDRALSQSYVYKYDATHVLRNIGIEKLQVDIVTAGELTETHAEDAIAFMGTEDSWIRDCTMKHFWHAGVQFEGSTRCTAERCRAIEPHSLVTGSRRYNFSMYHSQLVLVRDCFADRARHAYVCNGTSLDAGIVFLDCVSDRSLTASEGHRRWGTGFLFDNLVATNRQATDFLGLYNRGTYGTGHGWASAHSVAWNVNAAGGRIYLQRPPTAQNYAIGCAGNVTGNGPFAGGAGHIEGTGRAGLEPRSLYLAQLAQRLADERAAQLTADPRPFAAFAAEAGDTVVFSVGPARPGLHYQWYRGERALPGATHPTLVLSNLTVVDFGSYQVVITNAGGSTAGSRNSLTVISPSTPTRLVNLAIRSHAGTDAETLIVGTAIGGATATGTQPVLLRAAGPALGAFGLTGTLANPALVLSSPTALLGANDDWRGDAPIAAAAARVGAFAFPSATSADAALLHGGLGAGAYSMQVIASGGGAGLALAEIYDATIEDAFTRASPRLVNVSARTRVGTGGDILIAGFALRGAASKTVLIRAVGPGLAQFGLGGLLANPRLELFSGNNAVAANDDWENSTALVNAFASVGAFPLVSGSRDAALLVTLPPGSYTAQVSGVGGTTGVALVEVYTINP